MIECLPREWDECVLCAKEHGWNEWFHWATKPGDMCDECLQIHKKEGFPQACDGDKDVMQQAGRGSPRRSLA